MAWNLGRLGARVPRFLTLFTWTRTLPQFYSKFEVDAIDDFTSQLMQRKISKWELKKRQNDALIENRTTRVEDGRTEDIELEGLTSEQLGFLFQNALDSEDSSALLHLMKLSLERSRLPPFSMIISVLSICSQAGDKNLVQQIRNSCEIHYPELLEENSKFRHYLAEAIWVRGDVPKAVNLFEEVYRGNAYLRRRVRLVLKYLIADTVSNKSEVALQNIISFSERLVRDFQDFFPLACVWQACFLSEWYTDQCLALELLERNCGLCKSVINRIPYVVFVSLKCHRTEVVYRLLEVLLKYRMKQQYSNVLVTLLDYQFRCRDFVSCAEIIRWAVDNGVRLPHNQGIRLINLLVSEKMKTPQAPLEPKIEDKPKYNFKF